MLLLVRPTHAGGRNLHRDGQSPLKFPPGASLQELTQGCWVFSERIIRDQPELWLWNYRHWRYKPKDAGREYPFYASVAKKFDQAIAETRQNAAGD